MFQAVCKYCSKQRNSANFISFARSISGSFPSQEETSADEGDWRKELNYLVLSKESCLGLGNADISKFYEFNKSLVAEAFDEFYPDLTIRYPGGAIKGEAKVPVKEIQKPKAGCKGLQRLWKITQNERIMHRECMQDLRNVLGEGDKGVRILVQGLQGGGKSVALAALVEVMRAAGWIVMYAPHCGYMTAGGFYTKNPDTGKWDTPLIAQYILRGMLNSHSTKLLQKFSCGKQQNKEQNLQEVCQEALDSKSAAQICQLLQRVRDELIIQSGGSHKTAIVLDAYSALYYRTEYQEWTTRRQQQTLKPTDLTVASMFQLLEMTDTANCNIVCATTLGEQISPRVWIPHTADTIDYKLKRFSLEEVGSLMMYYACIGLTHQRPRAEDIKKAYAYSEGNAADLRRIFGMVLNRKQSQEQQQVDTIARALA